MADKINKNEQMELEDKDLEKLSGGVVKVVRKGTDGSQQEIKKECKSIPLDFIPPAKIPMRELKVVSGPSEELTVVKIDGSHGPTRR